MAVAVDLQKEVEGQAKLDGKGNGVYRTGILSLYASRLSSLMVEINK